MIQVEIISPTSIIYQGQADAITIDAYGGKLGILSHHAPMICQLKTGGEIILKSGEDKKSIKSNGGFLKVKDNQVKILTD